MLRDGYISYLLYDDEVMTNVHLLRRLGFKESFAIVVGSVIGTGIFLKTAVMAQEAGSPLSLPKIISGRSDDAIRTGPGWRE